MVVHDTQLAFRLGTPIFSCSSSHAYRFLQIFWRPLAILMHQSQVELSVWVFSISSLLVVGNCASEILLYSLTMLIHKTKIELCQGVPLLGSIRQEFYGFFVLFFFAVEHPQSVVVFPIYILSGSKRRNE